MTEQEANEIERREWAEEMAKREAESNANFGAGVSSLDSHIMDVEASGDDKKHEVPGSLNDLCVHGVSVWADCSVCGKGYPQKPIYTQQQLDEAVRAERGRCILACIDVSSEHQGNANRSHEQQQYEARDYFQAKAHAAAKCAGAIKGLKP